jgi:hypothetical protein
MARITHYTTRIEDVGGSFARFIREAPKEARALCKAAVESTTFAVLQRMRATAPVGPDAPHMKTDLSMKVRGLLGRVGILESQGEGDSAHVALYNEYLPNEQAFMRPAARAEQDTHTRRVKEALGQLERRLGSGTGI